MNIALPIIGLVLAVAAYVLGAKDAAGARPGLLGLLGLALFVALGAKFGAPNSSDVWPLAGGLAVGAVVGVAAEWLGVGAASLGLGVAGAALMPMFGKGTLTAELALAAGAMAATLFAAGGKFAALTAVAAAAVATIDALGGFNPDHPAAAHYGSILGTIATGIGVGVVALKFRSWVWPVGAALISGGAYFAEKRLGLVGVGLPAALGALTGLVALYLLPDDETDAFKMAVATVLWLGLATLAYGPARGFGMDIALFTGIAMPILLGRSRAVISSGPLAALVFVRLFNQIHGRESAALDISQHYVLIGLTVGAILPAAYDEWKARTPRMPALAGLLWSVLLVGIPVALSLLVEAKGLVGFIVGLGFGGLLLARRAAHTAQPLALTMGIAAACILIYGRMIDVETISRAQKMHFVGYAALAIAILAIPLGLLIRQKQEEQPA
ncbi:MAG: hypothetical protein ACYC96_04375 [Fimbriimonadaceae bacterium]